MPSSSQLDSTALAAAVIHEVRRLLTPARGYAELALRQTGLTPDVSKSLMATIEAAIACDAAMECIVSSRLDAGGSSPGLVVKQLLHDQTDVELTCSSTATVPMAAAAIEVLVSNLVNNARRSGSKEVPVRVSITNSSTGNTPHVHIQVSDQGNGMSDDETRRAVLPFVSNTASAGMGLAICRFLVERVGGKLSIYSAVGQGTCVEVLIPAIAAVRKAA